MATYISNTSANTTWVADTTVVTAARLNTENTNLYANDVALDTALALSHDATGYFNPTVGSDVASASALTLGTGNIFTITGTTAITSITTKSTGYMVWLQFAGALTLTHHATNLILPDDSNITTETNDIACLYEYGSGTWRLISYSRADATSGGFLTNVVEDTSPQLGGALDPNGQFIGWDKGTDITDGATPTIPTDGNYFDFGTGGTTVTSFVVAANRMFMIQFDAANTLTHHSTNLDLPSEANITTAAGDSCICFSTGTNTVHVLSYTKADGTPVAGGINNVVEDTTPQLGGALETNSFAINESEGANIASASAPDIFGNTDGNTVHITGTTTITDFADAPSAGIWRRIIFDGVLTLTHGSGVTLQGSANITTAAGDYAFVYADSTTAFTVLYFRADGTAVAGGGAVRIAADAQLNTNTNVSTVSDTYEDVVDFTGAGHLSAFTYQAASGTVEKLIIRITIDGGTPIEYDMATFITPGENIWNALALTFTIPLNLGFLTSCKVEGKNDTDTTAIKVGTSLAKNI